MRQCFNNRESALRSLEKRRALAYKKNEKLGWKVLGDNSFIRPGHKWSKPEKRPDGLYMSYPTKKVVWYVELIIITDELIRDLFKDSSFDVEAEIKKVLNNIPDELNKMIVKYSRQPQFKLIDNNSAVRLKDNILFTNGENNSLIKYKGRKGKVNRFLADYIHVMILIEREEDWGLTGDFEYLNKELIQVKINELEVNFFTSPGVTIWKKD